MKFATKFI